MATKFPKFSQTHKIQQREEFGMVSLAHDLEAHDGMTEDLYQRFSLHISVTVMDCRNLFHVAWQEILKHG
jgi:hypothetical protein